MNKAHYLVPLLLLSQTAVQQAQELPNIIHSMSVKKEKKLVVEISEAGDYSLNREKVSEAKLLSLLDSSIKENSQILLEVSAPLEIDDKILNGLLDSAVRRNVNEVRFINHPKRNVMRIKWIEKNHLVVGQRFYLSLASHSSVGIATKTELEEGSILKLVSQKWAYNKPLVSGKTGGDAAKTINIYEVEREGEAMIKVRKYFRGDLERENAISITATSAETFNK